MLATDLLIYLTRFAFIALGLVSVFMYLRYGGQVRRDIFLMLSSISLPTLFGQLAEISPQLSIVLSPVGSLALITQPFWLLLLLRNFQLIPKLIFRFTVLMMMISFISILMINDPFPPIISLLIVGYFVVINCYAMLGFVRQSIQTTGVTHQRLRFTALGAGLFAGCLFLVAILVLFPNSAEIVNPLVQLTAVIAAVMFYLGLTPLQWIRQTWQMRELESFLLEITHNEVRSDIESVFPYIIKATQNAIGSDDVRLIRWNSTTVESAPKNEKRAGTSDFKLDLLKKWIKETPISIAAENLTQKEKEHFSISNEAIIYIVPLRRNTFKWGILFIQLEHGSLFVEDDLNLLGMYAQQTCILLENIRLLNDSERHARDLEFIVQEKTAQLVRRTKFISMLQEITQLANETHSLDHLLQQVLDEICSQFAFDVGHIHFQDKIDPKFLTPSSFWYLRDELKYKPLKDMSRAIPSSFPSDAVKLAISNNTSVWLNDFSDSTEFSRAEIADEINLQTVIFVPIQITSSTKLILELFSESKLFEEQELIDLIFQIGTQIRYVFEREHDKLALRELNADLEKRSIHLQAVNKELEAFSYSVSHDLRAPLRAIDGFSQALLEDYQHVVDSEGLEYLTLVRFESQRMGNLIDDLIDLSRFTRTEMNVEVINLSQIVEKLVEDLKSQDTTRHVELIIQQDVVACADKNLIQAVLQNLLDNAWKYSRKKEPARIEFGKIEDADSIQYFIRDNGAGFSMVYAHKLFGAFQRLHSNDEYEGTGIGLATVQRIIHRHGGKIRAQAEIEQGATFYFSLGNTNCIQSGVGDEQFDLIGRR